MSEKILDSLKHYRQKSCMFLYPLLQISNDYITPVETYLSIKNYDLGLDKPFIAAYYNKERNFYNFLSKLEEHKFFHKSIKIKDLTLVVFDLSSMPKNYEIFKQGAYSSFTENAKILLSITRKPLVLRAIYPEHFIEEYVQHFGVSRENFPKELIPAPDFDKETLTLKKADFEILKKELSS